MSIWGRLAGAAAGLAESAHINGPVRGLLGAFAGAHFFNHDNDTTAQHQVAFTIGVIALGAKLAKADGIVTRDEVIAFKEVFKVPEGAPAKHIDLLPQDQVFRFQLCSRPNERSQDAKNQLE